jgi:cytochrome c oxidase subunit 2
VRFRERPDSPKPKQIHGHLGIEIAWTIVPALIVVAIAIPTIQTIFRTQQVDPDALVVDVIGHQYWWEFRYPENGRRHYRERAAHSGGEDRSLRGSGRTT